MGMVAHLCHSDTREAETRGSVGCEFKTRLSQIAKAYLKNKQIKL